MPVRHAGAVSSPARPRPARPAPPAGDAVVVLPLERARRYRGRLRRLQEPAPASLRQRIARELGAVAPPPRPGAAG